eukprot:m.82169 g.82169  ORF g.82169 m.82169 type:complete len:101 (+) comp14603_c0_seq3:1709-2011(+)
MTMEGRQCSRCTRCEASLSWDDAPVSGQLSKPAEGMASHSTIIPLYQLCSWIETDWCRFSIKNQAAHPFGKTNQANLRASISKSRATSIDHIDLKLTGGS